FFSSRRRHTRFSRDWSSDVCSSDLWFNAHPAQVIMGDLGSLALGATLALVALMTGQWLLLPVIGLVFVAEAASVVIQRYYFKWRSEERRVGKECRSRRLNNDEISKK